MRKYLMIPLILGLAFLIPMQPSTNTITSTGSDLYISMEQTFNKWEDLHPTSNSSYAFSTATTYWSRGSMNLLGTEKMNLTSNNLEQSLTNNSLFNFAWKFQSTAYDYIGFILYTPNNSYNSYFITSDFGHTIFGNSSTQGIYEFTNEQPNTWYEHEVNLTALFLQTYSYLPEKIVSIDMVNAYFGANGLLDSDQVSYFDNFKIYTPQ